MGDRVREVRVKAVQDWEQTDLLGLWAAPAGAGAEGESQGPVALAAAEVEAPEGGASEGEVVEGEESEGGVAEGGAAKGEASEGEASEDEVAEGGACEGGAAEGGAVEGGASEDEVAEGEPSEGQVADGEVLDSGAGALALEAAGAERGTSMGWIAVSVASGSEVLDPPAVASASRDSMNLASDLACEALDPAGAAEAGARSVVPLGVDSEGVDPRDVDWPSTDPRGAASDREATAVSPVVIAPETPTTGPLLSGQDHADRPPDRVTPAISLPEFTPTSSRGTPPVPERLLILDTETTALHPKEGACIEVGAVLFHVATRSVLTQVSFLLPCEVNGAEAINGIPAAVSQLEQPWREALGCFLAMVASADAILAHNAAFDRQWFGRGLLPPLEKPWICSMEDIGWPPERHLRANPSVRDLAIAHGVPVWAAHRALTDCTYLVQVLERCDDLESLLRLAGEPRRLYRAQLGYNERQQAKDAGFRWNEPVAGAWTKRLSEREVAALPFPVKPVVSV